MIYDKHIFICTNQRPENTRVSCGESHGLMLVASFKKKLKDKNIDIDIRTQKSGCLDLCESGPMLVVYPDGVFYGNVNENDIDEIIESLIIANKPVERLIINNKNKK